MRGRFGNPMRHLFTALLAGCLFPSAPSAQDPTSNLSGNIGIHDPSSVIKSNGVYYVYATGGGMKFSPDRKVWSNGVHPINGAKGLTKQAWWSEHGGSIWAPEVSYMDGMYYFFYSVSNSGNVDNSAIGVAVSPSLDPNDAAYKWTDKGKVIDSKVAGAATKPNVNAIDPSTFVDDDGKWYLVFGSYNEGVRMVELNRATGLVTANPPKVWMMTDHTGEASFIHKWKNYYYYSVSRGKCCSGTTSDYQIIYGRSSTLVTGPYTNKNGSTFSVYAQATNTLLLGKGGSYPGGMGGQSFFWDNDSLFIDYHAYSTYGTNLYIRPMYADAQGWLTTDATKGTIMTGASKGTTTAIAPVAKRISAPSRLNLRLAGTGLEGSEGMLGSLYSTSGRKLFAPADRVMPAGIYIEKTGSAATER